MHTDQSFCLLNLVFLQLHQQFILSLRQDIVDASLLAKRGSGARDLDLFGRLVDKSLDKDFLVIRGWNEFSSTDEGVIAGAPGVAFTIEMVRKRREKKADAVPE